MKTQQNARAKYEAVQRLIGAVRERDPDRIQAAILMLALEADADESKQLIEVLMPLYFEAPHPDDDFMENEFGLSLPVGLDGEYITLSKDQPGEESHGVYCLRDLGDGDGPLWRSLLYYGD